MRMDGYIVSLSVYANDLNWRSRLWVPDLASALWLVSALGRRWYGSGTYISWCDASDPIGWTEFAADASDLYRRAILTFGSAEVRRNCTRIAEPPSDSLGLFVVMAKELDLMGHVPATRVLEHALSVSDGGTGRITRDAPERTELANTLEALRAAPEGSRARGWGGPPVDPLAAPARVRSTPVSRPEESAAPNSDRRTEARVQSDFRSTRWITAATRNELTSGALGQMRRRRELKNVFLNGDVWLHDIKELAAARPDHAAKLLKALEKSNDLTSAPKLRTKKRKNHEG